MNLITQNLWVGLALWGALSISDSVLTVACARMYRAGARNVLAFEGSYELTTFHQGEVEALRTFGPRFFLALLWGGIVLAAAWFASRDAYAFVLGATVLVEGAVHVRHARNIVTFRRILSGDGASGRIEFSRALLERVSAFEFAAFAATFGIAFLAVPALFLAGGTFGCVALAMSHIPRIRKLANERER